MSAEHLKIQDLKARTVMVPTKRPLRTASGSIPAVPLLLLDVETDAGVTGSAYVFGYAPITLAPMAAISKSLREMIVGKPVAPAERARELEAKFRLLGRQGLLGMVLSGLDMALWDALARAHDVPVVQLLGGEKRPVPAYDSYGIVDPKENRVELEASLAQGFKAIKIKVGDGDLAHDVKTIAGVREIIGDDVALMIDYNQSLTVPEAIRRAERLAEFDLHWIEEPVAAEDLAGHAEIRAASPIPIQTGENWWFPQDMAHAIEAGACDMAMPDLMKIGGITAWQRAAGQAEAASIPMSSHLFIEASAHVLPVTPTCHWLEYLDAAGAILADPPVVQDGMVAACGPGLGINWDESAVERHAV